MDTRCEYRDKKHREDRYQCIDHKYGRRFCKKHKIKTLRQKIERVKRDVEQTIHKLENRGLVMEEHEYNDVYYELDMLEDYLRFIKDCSNLPSIKKCGHKCYGIEQRCCQCRFSFILDHRCPLCRGY